MQRWLGWGGGQSRGADAVVRGLMASGGALAVGGPVLDAVLENLAPKARIAICGQISQYNAPEVPLGPRNISALLRTQSKAEGFLVYAFERQHEISRARLAAWIKEGLLKYTEDIVDGFERAPDAFIGLLRGDNFGKLLIKVSD